MQPERIDDPDEQRHLKVSAFADDDGDPGELLWQRSLKEVWGNQSMTVFRSRYLQKLVWKYKKVDLWVVYNKYDTQKEDEDESYADMIEQLMSRPPETYLHSVAGSIVTTTTTTTTTTTVVPPLKRKRAAASSNKKASASDEVFVPPSLAPAPTLTASQRAAIVEAKNGKGVLDPMNPAPAAAAAAAALAPASAPASAAAPAAPAPAPAASMSEAAAPAPAPAAAASEAAAPAPADSARRPRKEVNEDSEDDDVPLVQRKKLSAAASSSNAVQQETSNVMQKEDERLVKAVVDAEQLAAELAAEKAKNQQLQKERDDETSRAEAESSRAERAETLHKNYMSRNRRKMKDNEAAMENALEETARLKKERFMYETSVQAERDAMRTKYESAQRALKAVKSGNADPNDKSAGLPCVDAYVQIINHTKKCYEVSAQSKLTGTVQPSTQQVAKFQFLDQNSVWQDISDDNLVMGLTALVDKSATEFGYTVGGHTYKARLADGDWIGHCDIVQQNTNPQYATERPIRLNPQYQTSAASASSPQPKTVLTEEDKKDILFGNSVVTLTQSWIEALLTTYSFDDSEHYSKACLELAQLAQVFNSFSSGLTYFQGTKHTTEVYVKPLALYNWLKLAAARNYTRMRLVLHGSDTACYQGVRDDPFGMDLKFAGSHGQAYGNGFYFGMSDHVTNGYNTEVNSKGKREGTALMALVLTGESLDGYHYSYRRGSYGTFNLGYTDRNTNNCLAVYEDRLILVLGKMVPL